jgi:hypothetical protein
MKAQFLALALISGGAFAAPETFKLYDEPNATPSEGCDVHTQLKLNVDGTSATADLKERVLGGCEIFVAANPRSYAVEGEDDGCGSVIYRDADEQIKITDNRARSCENVIPALIVVDEHNAEGQRLPRKYSKDN